MTDTPPEEHRKNHSAVCLKMETFMVCDFYLNKKGTGWFRTHSRLSSKRKGEVEKTPSTGDAVFTHNGEIEIPNYKT